MEKKKYFYTVLTVIFCFLIAALGWVYLVYGTTIGTDVSTVDVTASGTTTVTGDLTVSGTTTLTGALTVSGTTTLGVVIMGTNFIIGAEGNASTTKGFIVGTTTIGGGTALTSVIHGTGSLDPPSIDPVSTASGTISVTGAAATMRCFIQPPYNLNDDLIYKTCSTTANTLQIYIYNAATTSAVDDGATTWGYLLVK